MTAWPGEKIQVDSCNERRLMVCKTKERQSVDEQTNGRTRELYVQSFAVSVSHPDAVFIFADVRFGRIIL